MITPFRKILLAAVAVVTVVGASLPASAQGWGGGGGWDRGGGRGWDRGEERGWHHRHHGWDRPRCWMEERPVWVDTRWGPQQRVREVRVCR